MEVLFGMALQQTTDFVETLIDLPDLDWAVSHARKQRGPKDGSGARFTLASIRQHRRPALSRSRGSHRQCGQCGTICSARSIWT
jgi:hypothetical protein